MLNQQQEPVVNVNRNELMFIRSEILNDVLEVLKIGRSKKGRLGKGQDNVSRRPSLSLKTTRMVELVLQRSQFIVCRFRKYKPPPFNKR